MKTRTMMDIHIDALASAAGIVSVQHLSVSHAPAVSRQRKHKIKRGTLTLLNLCSRLLGTVEAGLKARISRIEADLKLGQPCCP